MIRVRIDKPITPELRKWFQQNSIDTSLFIRNVTKPDGYVYYSIEMPASMATLYHLTWS